MIAVLHPSTIKAVSDVLLNNDDLMAPIAIFVSNYDEEKSIRVKKDKDLAGPKKKIRELSPSPPALDPSDNDDIPSKQKKNRQLLRDKKNKKFLSLSASFFQDNVWCVTSSSRSIEIDDSSSSTSTEKKKTDRAPRLKVLQLVQESFAMVVDYGTYRLKSSFSGMTQRSRRESPSWWRNQDLNLMIRISTSLIQSPFKQF